MMDRIEPAAIQDFLVDWFVKHMSHEDPKIPAYQNDQHEWLKNRRSPEARQFSPVCSPARSIADSRAKGASTRARDYFLKSRSAAAASFAILAASTAASVARAVARAASIDAWTAVSSA
jgi:hypothetical protein